MIPQPNTINIREDIILSYILSFVLATEGAGSQLIRGATPHGCWLPYSDLHSSFETSLTIHLRLTRLSESFGDMSWIHRLSTTMDALFDPRGWGNNVLDMDKR